MIVEDPKVLWTQNAEGKWKLPEPEEAEAISKEAAATPPPAGTPPPEKAEEKTEKKPAKIAVVIQRFEVKNGTIEFLDSKRQPVAVFTAVNLTYTTVSEERVEGLATIGKVVWADGLAMENVRSPFVHSGQEWKLPELTGTLGGGTVRGSYQARMDDGNTAWQATANFSKVDLERVVAEAGGKPGQARGELAGQIEARGDSRKPDKAEGSGQLDLRNGQFKELDLFQNVGSLLGVREFSDLRVKDGHADLRLTGDKVNVERLLLNTSDLQLSSKGAIRLDKKVSLEAQLSVEEALVKQLPGMVRDSFVATDSGRRAIDFNITGTTDKLKTNLLDKLMGQKINAQFGDLLGSLFGSDKKEEERKKKEEEERKKAEKAEKDRKKKEKEKGAAGATPAPAAAAPSAPTTSLVPATPAPAPRP